MGYTSLEDRGDLFASNEHDTNCSFKLDDIRWLDFSHVFSLSILLCLDVVVIAGNTMVIMAVYYTCKLRSVTNLFIVSLAVADLMVGLAVLPFSATRQVYRVWLFGEFLCSVWLAVDVWMCTASILNLCAISLDRYVAVTRPVSYPNIMSMKRAKILVGLVWILSFVICFPPLLGWKEKKHKPSYVLSSSTNSQSSSSLSSYRSWQESSSSSSCPYVCELTDDPGYVIYSALGSFYIPTFVMLFFYWNIYRAAAQTTKAINRGFRTTRITKSAASHSNSSSSGKKNSTADNSGNRGIGNSKRFDENRLTLRIHRGKGSSVRRAAVTTSSNNSLNNNSVETSPGLRSPDTRFRRSSTTTRRYATAAIRGGLDDNGLGHEHIKISVSFPSSDCLNENRNNNSLLSESFPPRSDSISSSSLSNSGGTLYAIHCPLTDTSGSLFRKDVASTHHLRVDGGRLSSAADICPSSSNNNNNNNNNNNINNNKNNLRRDSSIDLSSTSYNIVRTRHMSDQLTSVRHQSLSSSRSFDDGVSSITPITGAGGINSKPKLIAKMGKRNIKSHAKKFKMETKAAKTLAIIVGGFILCWLPFFTLYLLRGLFDYRVGDTVFAVIFWLGYCNSAINPMIYALFSKDFRFAFQRIIYSCFSNKFSLRDSKTSRRGSDGSQLATGGATCANKRSDRSPSYQEFHTTPNVVVVVGNNEDSTGSASASASASASR